MAHDPRLVESVARGICVKAYGKLGDPNGTEWPEFAHLATAALDAIEAAGCVVVPVEPTPEMIEQGAWEISEDRQESALAVYKLMVAARPGAEP